MYLLIKMLITPCRFDLMIKYLYVFSIEHQLKTNFFKNMYKNHIITFNGCKEDNKVCMNDFIISFNQLITHIKNNGFDEKYQIPVGNNNVIINGAHRTAICHFYDIQPKILHVNEEGYEGYNYKFFLNRRSNPSLKQIYADSAALEYIKHNDNIRAMIVYPTAMSLNKLNELFQLIELENYIYYSKCVKLTSHGVNNLIKEMYRSEDWIGGLFPPGYSPGGKARLCVKEGFETMIILIEIKDRDLKEKCRNLFGLGKHSLHISDYPIDTFRIASSLLNENSIHFLNNGTNDITSNTKQLLKKYFENIYKSEDYCLTSSVIMEMYALRSAKDIDYLHKNDSKISINNIGIHDGEWLSYYNIHKDDIIYNPNNHFYFNGFKFATLNIVKKMKENRKEKKDIDDIKLICNTFK